MTRRAVVGGIVFVAALPGLSVLPAQADWQLCGSVASARIGGAARAELVGPRASATKLSAGECTVNFGSDALGRPAPLQFAVPDGARVHVAVEPAGPSAARSVPLAGEEWHETAGVDTVRTTGSPDDGDYCVEATVLAAATSQIVGVVARWRSANEFYACVLDLARGEVRIERHLGPDAFVLAKAAVSSAAAEPRRLALQVQGFRLQAVLDDAIVLQLFDGAVTKGAFGICWRGAAPAWQGLRLSPPAMQRASAALVRAADGTAMLHAATAVTPGHWHVLELALDRPHALVPRDAAGLEPWLLMRSAGPWVLDTDLRGLLGKDTFGEVPANGNVSHPVEWPDLPRLRLQAALVRMLLVTADGSTVTAATPAVPLHF